MKRNMTRKSAISSTHDMHFDGIIADLVKTAYENEKLNRKSKYRPKGSGVNKKSPVQNGASSVACLLIFITLESIVRRKYFFTKGSDKTKAYSKDLWWVIKKLKPGIDQDSVFKNYFDELNLIRDIIAHAYIFEGSLEWKDDNHRLIAISEKVVSGKRMKDVGRSRLTRYLKLHKAPNQMSFSDVAKFYLAYEVLLETIGIGAPYDLWIWSRGNDLTPSEWLEKAGKKLGYAKAKIWNELKEKKDEEDYKSFLGELGDLGFPS